MCKKINLKKQISIELLYNILFIRVFSLLDLNKDEKNYSTKYFRNYKVQD